MMSIERKVSSGNKRRVSSGVNERVDCNVIANNLHCFFPSKLHKS